MAAARDDDGSLRPGRARGRLAAPKRRAWTRGPDALSRDTHFHSWHLSLLFRMARRAWRVVSRRGLRRLHGRGDGLLHSFSGRPGAGDPAPSRLVGRVVGRRALAPLGASKPPETAARVDV